ncbi:MAG: oxygen-independent coproporphyrinogen III oxidase [Winogradskyella sp.]|uniref:oxygen-independent coproporphyrinogen III oxidase n=1 Tax=Winogradskyella sp. TaxID=1883156 RepID=UPI000F3DD394|nr:oxygen-independent coproporphyrinogen III oxidase [Winogradskyella sp.]RNC87221.1 MAG: oxygen-independent coproporphyrinogen III oxidase [Winogradskyella sp.]
MCTLVSKYNVAGPRYTSYPTVPYWNQDQFSLKAWKSSLKQRFYERKDGRKISLYIHLPFCESMCTFCGCTKRITKNHDVETPYIKSLIKEFSMYVDLLGEKPIVSQIHLGGGTPTFFTPDNLSMLINGILMMARKPENVEFSFEGHPNNTSKEHLIVLNELGFKRVCYGVQDYNEKVQKAINRIQPYENVSRTTLTARSVGYESVGHDLIYGLPFQTKEDVINTIASTVKLRPERIAFYSYAHVPWIKGNGQRGFKDCDLPTAKQKRIQYEVGKMMLLDAGYEDIGMDHFALPNDELSKAKASGNLHRNFMGYTSRKTNLMIGLGVSAIADSWYGFAQNVKSVEAYQDLVNKTIFPVYRGHILTNEDLVIRQHILNLMCRFETSWEDDALYFPEIPDVLVKLKELEHDGLVNLYTHKIEVTEKGKPFVRNICLPFDLRLQRKKPDTKLFSMTI